jgi:hypothetical protein
MDRGIRGLAAWFRCQASWVVSCLDGHQSRSRVRRSVSGESSHGMSLILRSSARRARGQLVGLVLI